MSSNIKCPKCGESFSLSESISNEELRKAANIDIEKELNEKLKNEITRIEEEQKKNFSIKEDEFLKTQSSLKQKLSDYEQEKKNFEDEKKEYKSSIERKMKQTLAEDKAKIIEMKSNYELKEKLLQNQQDLYKKSIEEQSRIKIESELEKKNLEIEQIRQAAEIKEKRLNDKLSELQKGSGADVELQGESFEDIVKDSMQNEFPGYPIYDVPKGKSGADLIMETPIGGKLIVEAKSVKQFKSDFIDKIKDDIEFSKANHGVIVVANQMPTIAKGKAYHEVNSRVSIVHYSAFVPILRTKITLIDTILKNQQKLEGSLEKKDQLYAYVSSEKFRNRIQTIMDSIAEQNAQLEKEKKDSQKNFAKRDATLERLSDNLLRGFDIEMRQYLEPSKNEIDVESDSD